MNYNMYFVYKYSNFIPNNATVLHIRKLSITKQHYKITEAILPEKATYALILSMFNLHVICVACIVLGKDFCN